MNEDTRIKAQTTKAMMRPMIIRRRVASEGLRVMILYVHAGRQLEKRMLCYVY